MAADRQNSALPGFGRSSRSGTAARHRSSERWDPGTRPEDALRVQEVGVERESCHGILPAAVGANGGGDGEAPLGGQPAVCGGEPLAGPGRRLCPDPPSLWSGAGGALRLWSRFAALGGPLAL